MPTNSIAWFEISVQDMSRARTFYEVVLTTSLKKMNGGDLEMCGGPRLGTSAGRPRWRTMHSVTADA